MSNFVMYHGQRIHGTNKRVPTRPKGDCCSISGIRGSASAVPVAKEGLLCAIRSKQNDIRFVIRAAIPHSTQLEPCAFIGLEDRVGCSHILA